MKRNTANERGPFTSGFWAHEAQKPRLPSQTQADSSERRTPRRCHARQSRTDLSDNSRGGGGGRVAAVLRGWAREGCWFKSRCSHCSHVSDTTELQPAAYKERYLTSPHLGPPCLQYTYAVPHILPHTHS